MTCAISYTAKKGFVVPDNCKVMALCDDTVETVVGAELLSNPAPLSATTGYTAFNSTLSVVSNAIRSTCSVNGQFGWRASVTTVVGSVYIFTIRVNAEAVTGNIFCGASNSPTAYELDVQILASTGTAILQFTATATTTYINAISSSGGLAGETFDCNITSARIGDADISGNDKGLAVYGSITKAASATNSTTVAYSGFSASNYLYQPYNSDLDFGTADFHIGAWAKTTGTGIEMICARGTDPGGSVLMLYFTGGNIRFLVVDSVDAASDTFTTPSDYNDGDWHFVVCQRVSGYIYLYIDGSLAVSGALVDALSSLSNTSGTLTVGVHVDTSQYIFNGSIAGVRIGTGSLTAAQIKEIYDKEKSMFRYGGVFAIDGQSSTIDMDGVAALDRRAPANVGETNVAYDNSAWGVTYCTDAGWSVTTDQFDEADRGTWEHFFESVKAGESFTFDAFGTIASPADARTYRMLPGAKIQRISSASKYRASFEMSEIDA